MLYLVLEMVYLVFEVVDLAVEFFYTSLEKFFVALVTNISCARKLLMETNLKANVDDNDDSDNFETSDGDNMKTMVDDNVGDNVETSVLGEVGQRAPLGALTASTVGSNQHTLLVLCL